MTNQVNIPYINEYNEKGKLMNPINGIYKHEFPNRQTRRQQANPIRHHGNGKNYHLTVVKESKFHRYLQHEIDKNGQKKVILHYN